MKRILGCGHGPFVFAQAMRLRTGCWPCLVLIGLSGLWCVAESVQAEDKPLSLDLVGHDEILRLGNVAQRLGAGRNGEGEHAFVAAMGPPASDKEKWFISVITTRGCAPCEKLQREFSSDPWLHALADPQNPERSWSHFNRYDRSDRSQMWRFDKLRIDSYPTILVQPPRSGSYGPPGTVVFQGSYQGDPRRLATEMTQAIRRYLEKYAAVKSASSPLADSAADPSSRRPDFTVGSKLGNAVFTPPWQPIPKDDLPDGGSQPVIVPPVLPDVTPPTPVPQPAPAPTPQQTPSPVPVVPVPVVPVQPLIPVPPVEPVQPAPQPIPIAPIPIAPIPISPTPISPTPPIPTRLEAVIVTDADLTSSAESESRIQQVVTSLRRERGQQLRVRRIDWKDAQFRYPLERDELPVVLITSNGRVEDKISAGLLPFVDQSVPPVTLADLPWSAVMTLLTTGFSLSAAGTLAIWLIRWLRTQRQNAGQAPFLNDASFTRVIQLLERLSDASPRSASSLPAAVPGLNGGVPAAARTEPVATSAMPQVAAASAVPAGMSSPGMSSPAMSSVAASNH